MRTLLLATLMLLALEGPALADETSLGGAGESCRARLDCENGLRCVNRVCVEAPNATGQPQPCQSTANCGELRCVEGRCVNPFRMARNAAATSNWRWFVGLVLLGGPAFGGVISGFSRWDRAAQPSLVGAIRVGAIIDERHELAIELSPFSYAYYQPMPGPTFQVNATYGYRIPLVTSPSVTVDWPFRFGAGFFTGNTGGDVYAQLRADLLGVSIRRGDFMIDLYAPSFRYAITSVGGETANVLSWESGVGVSYLF